jgi:hypothetical protein
MKKPSANPGLLKKVAPTKMPPKFISIKQGDMTNGIQKIIGVKENGVEEVFVDL